MTYINALPSFAQWHCLDPAPSSAPWQPRGQGDPCHANGHGGDGWDSPLLPHMPGGVRWAETPQLCRWRRQRGCKLLSAPSLSTCPTWGSIPEPIPRAGRRERAATGRSFSSGRAAFAGAVALALGLAQQELCCTRNMTENFICHSSWRKSQFPRGPWKLCCCLQQGLTSACLCCLCKTSLCHHFGCINTHHGSRHNWANSIWKWVFHSKIKTSASFFWAILHMTFWFTSKNSRE